MLLWYHSAVWQSPPLVFLNAMRKCFNRMLCCFVFVIRTLVAQIAYAMSYAMASDYMRSVEMVV